MRKYLYMTMAALSLAVLPVAGVYAQDFDGDNDVRMDTDNDFDIRPYAGVGIGAFGLEEKEPGFSQKNTVFGGFGKFGVDIGDYLGAELRVGATSTGTNSYPAGTAGIPAPFDVSLSDDYFISYLAKVQYPVTLDFRPYALIGGTTAKVKGAVSVSGLSGAVSTTKTGFSYGFGADYYLQDQLSIGGEWMQYWTNVNIATNSEAKMWGAVATVAYHF